MEATINAVVANSKSRVVLTRYDTSFPTNKGMNLFIINAMDRETPMTETYKAVLFFVGSDILRVVLLVAFPAITLFLLP